MFSFGKALVLLILFLALLGKGIKFPFTIRGFIRSRDPGTGTRLL